MAQYNGSFRLDKLCEKATRVVHTALYALKLLVLTSDGS